MAVYTIVKGHLYKQVSEMGGVLTYDRPVKIAESDQARALWRGRKLDLARWNQIREILKSAQPDEALVLLMYHADHGWRYFVPPQSGSGASVHANKDLEHPLYVEYHRLLADGYMEFGSIHTHPGFNAFQSGTDKHDEDGKEGFHITLGNISEDVWSIHCRLVIRGNSYSFVLPDLVDFPHWDVLRTYSQRVQDAWHLDQLAMALCNVEPVTHGEDDKFQKEVKTLDADPFLRASSISTDKGGPPSAEKNSKSRKHGKKPILISWNEDGSGNFEM